MVWPTDRDIQAAYDGPFRQGEGQCKQCKKKMQIGGPQSTLEADVRRLPVSSKYWRLWQKVIEKARESGDHWHEGPNGKCGPVLYLPGEPPPLPEE